MQDSSGWLTTKRRGRDDDAIEAAAAQAVVARRAKRGLAKKGNRKTTTTKNNKKKKPAKKRMEDSDSEEFDEYEDEEESEEELSDVVDDDDDDEEPSSFLPKNVGKPSKALARKRRAVGGTSAFNPVSLSSGDELSEPSPAPRKKPRAAAARKKPTTVDNTIQIPSSDEDNAHFGASKCFSAKNKNSKTNNSSSNNNNKPSSKDPWSSDDDDDDDHTPGRPTKKKRIQGKTKRMVLDESDDEEITPPPKAASRPTLDPDFDDSSDDSDIEYKKLLQKATRESLKEQKKTRLKKLGNKKAAKLNNKKSSSSNHNSRRKKAPDNACTSSSPVDDFLKDSDEEEEAAPEIEEEEEEVVDLLDDSSSSSSEDEQGAEEDEYMDEEAKEASSILSTANELSASVLRIMTSWASDNNDDNNSSVPQGMIVDGAIAISSLKTTKEQKSSQKHNWISNQVMKEILPTVTLADYQLIGVNWLAMLHGLTCTLKNKNANGKRKKATKTNVNGVLADEMGLGKTCQTIAFLAWLKHSRERGTLGEENEAAIHAESQQGDDDNDDNDNDVDGSDNEHAEVTVRGNDEESSPDTRLPHLIVVPASVVSNWQREFETFAPHLSVVCYHGNQDERLDLQDELRPYLSKTRNQSLPMIDVILTSITYFQKEKSDDRDFLRKFRCFDYLIVDEGHMLKNAKGHRYRNLDRFRTRHRLLLTGTPVQNSPKELMALLCFLMPLFSRRATADYGDSNENDGGETMLQHFVQLEGDGNNDGQSSEESAYRKLKQLFAPFVLRRRKHDVLSQILPPKIYQVERVTLDDRARKIYNGVISDHVQAKKNKSASSTDHLFTALRKAANHPLLLRTRYKTPAELDHLATSFYKYGAFRGEASTKERVAIELEKYSDFEIHLTALDIMVPGRERDLDRYILSEDDLFCSAKFVQLRSLLPELIKGGHRILIFSVWTTLLDLLSCLLENLNLNYRRMDGQTPVAERQSRIDEFNSDESIKIFLLSTRACGLGINLTSADTCIMHDLDFNPFADLQAEDRCHRIGQKKPVTIIKMVANESVDAEIYNMQERKAKMESAIMSSTDWSKQEKKEKSTVIKNVMDQFLKSPQGQSSKSKGARVVDAKENVVNLADDDESEAEI